MSGSGSRVHGKEKSTEVVAVPVYFQFLPDIVSVNLNCPAGYVKRFGDLFCLPSIFDQTRNVHFGGCKTEVADGPQKG